MGAVGEQSLDDVDVHFMAVPAHRMIAVYVPVAVYEVIHVAVIPLAICYDILKIKLSCSGEQSEKFLRYILFCKDVMEMLSSFKKRDDFLFCSFILNYLFFVYTLTHKSLLNPFRKTSQRLVFVDCLISFALVRGLIQAYNSTKKEEIATQ